MSRTETPGLGLCSVAQRTQNVCRAAYAAYAPISRRQPSTWAVPLFRRSSPSAADAYRCPVPPPAFISEAVRPFPQRHPCRSASLRSASRHTVALDSAVFAILRVGCSPSARLPSASTATTSGRSRAVAMTTTRAVARRPGSGLGPGQQALGLSGHVSAERVGALIAGRDPGSRGVRLRASERDPKVAALDLTFSAPKSLSVLFAVSPEELSGELVACHEEAVRAALEYLQAEAVMVRRGEAGKHVERAEGLIAAAYRHRISRALDPQLHTHVVAANMARGGDGRFTALHGAALYRSAKTAASSTRHTCARWCVSVSAFGGAVHKGASELEGVERPVVEHFSKRRERCSAQPKRAGSALRRRPRRRRGPRDPRSQAVWDRDPHLARGGPLARGRARARC